MRLAAFFARTGGRAVECTGLENRHGCKPIVGSNPTLSATSLISRRFASLMAPMGRPDRPAGSRPLGSEFELRPELSSTIASRHLVTKIGDTRAIVPAGLFVSFHLPNAEPCRVPILPVRSVPWRSCRYRETHRSPDTVATKSGSGDRCRHRFRRSERASPASGDSPKTPQASHRHEVLCPIASREAHLSRC